jgi:hypothetical protein
MLVEPPPIHPIQTPAITDHLVQPGVAGQMRPGLGDQGPPRKPCMLLDWHPLHSQRKLGGRINQDDRLPSIDGHLDLVQVAARVGDLPFPRGALRNSYAKASVGLHCGRVEGNESVSAHLWRSPRWPRQPFSPWRKPDRPLPRPEPATSCMHSWTVGWMDWRHTCPRPPQPGGADPSRVCHAPGVDGQDY